MVLYAGRLFGDSGIDFLDGMDCLSAHQHLVSTGCVCPVRIWHSVCVHHLLPVHHRFLRDFCGECFGIHHSDPIHCGWKHDYCRHSLLRELGSALHLNNPCVYLGPSSASAIHLLQVWALDQVQEQVCYQRKCGRKVSAFPNHSLSSRLLGRVGHSQTSQD